MSNTVVVASSRPLEEVCRRLEKSVAEYRFGVLHVYDVRRTLQEKGVSFEREVRIFDVCNPQQAKIVLDKEPMMSAALPCAISVYADGPGTKLAFLRPSVMLGLFGVTGLDKVASEVERAVTDIVKTAAL